MIRSDFNFRRFLDTFVPGFIVGIATWYLFKPIINRYFPTIAFDAVNADFSNEIKILGLLVISFFLGILINHFSDVTVALIYPNSISEKSKRPFKRIAVLMFGLISWSNNEDPRIYAINRYLHSRRKDNFLLMLQKWAFTTEKFIENNSEECIVTHQHICTRLRALSPESEKIFTDCIEEVKFSASLLTSITVLFPLTLISLISNNVFLTLSQPKMDLKFLDNATITTLLILEFILMILLSYSLRRRFRHFSSQILTIALHFFDQSERSLNNE